MKKFYAKYLPVDGEINVGDTFHSKWRSEHKFVHHVTVGSITDDLYISENGTPYSKSDATSKVKLFICSRDIQVGGEFYAIDMSKQIAKENYEKLDHDFKVIGEVSPEAIWVKNGDEFDTEELSFRMIPDTPSPAHIKFIHTQDFAPGIAMCKKGYWTVGVKNISCGHYH